MRRRRCLPWQCMPSCGESLVRLHVRPTIATCAEHCCVCDVQVTKQIFEEGLGLAGVSLLKQGVRSLVDDVERLEPYFANLSVGQE